MYTVESISELYIRMINKASTCGEIHKIYTRMKLLLVAYAFRYGKHPAQQIRSNVLTNCYKRILDAEVLLGMMRK